ncbi:hypothetical protein G7061_04040 [Erysipelothrix sp. HDW6B]|uniref:SIR2 family protein n=1 Tax=Erysipelothrix sp. HDW6B TaxID=2714929 RepID=UPI00140BE680|nr:SIR2 family protein [Erysipelothrix sp. HDW6B]QIK85825.1 hypothetical protein G7061_04040 [Erysipelothrix sp. HDW6B]
MKFQSVLKKIVDGKRLPVLFVGAGLSKRYIKDSPDWIGVIRESFEIIDPSGVTYAQELDKCNQNNFTIFETNQHLGSRAETLYNDYFFNSIKGKPKESIPNWVEQGVSPYKIFLKNRFKKISLKQNGYLKKEISLLRNLNNKVSSIITTNYDKLLEDHIFNEGFDVYINQSDLFKSDRFNIAEIYKIHGCITDVNSLVFTEQDYKIFNYNRRLIIAKMLTLFSDSPIIFLGYSLEDENIRNIILDFLECIDKDDFDKIEDHFIFVEFKENEKLLIETRENIVTSRGSIPITKISTDNYSRLYLELNSVTPGLPSSLVKSAKRLIKKIVDSSLETGDATTIVVNSDELENVEDGQIAIAFGKKESILGRFGYSTFHITNLFEDILFDSFGYVPNLIVSERLKSVAWTTLVPIYKYYDKLTVEEKQMNTHLEKFLVRDSYQTIYGNNNIRNISLIPEFKDFNEFHDYIDSFDDAKIDKIFKSFSRSITNFSISEIRSICIEYFLADRNQCMQSTFFKRCVMYLDLLENKKT